MRACGIYDPLGSERVPFGFRSRRLSGATFLSYARLVPESRRTAPALIRVFHESIHRGSSVPGTILLHTGLPGTAPVPMFRAKPIPHVAGL